MREKQKKKRKKRKKSRPTTGGGRDRKPVVQRANKRRIQSRNVTMRAVKHTL